MMSSDHFNQSAKDDENVIALPSKDVDQTVTHSKKKRNRVRKENSIPFNVEFKSKPSGYSSNTSFVGEDELNVSLCSLDVQGSCSTIEELSPVNETVEDGCCQDGASSVNLHSVISSESIASQQTSTSDDKDNDVEKLLSEVKKWRVQSQVYEKECKSLKEDFKKLNEENEQLRKSTKNDSKKIAKENEKLKDKNVSLQKELADKITEFERVNCEKTAFFDRMQTLDRENNRLQNALKSRSNVDDEVELANERRAVCAEITVLTLQKNYEVEMKERSLSDVKFIIAHLDIIISNCVGEDKRAAKEYQNDFVAIMKQLNLDIKSIKNEFEAQISLVKNGERLADLRRIRPPVLPTPPPTLQLMQYLKKPVNSSLSNENRIAENMAINDRSTTPLPSESDQHVPFGNWKNPPLFSTHLHPHHVPVDSECKIGTTLTKYAPIPCLDTAIRNSISSRVSCNLMAITAIKEYTDKSFEELRAEDYKAIRHRVFSYFQPTALNKNASPFMGTSFHSSRGHRNSDCSSIASNRDYSVVSPISHQPPANNSSSFYSFYHNNNNNNNNESKTTSSALPKDLPPSVVPVFDLPKARQPAPPGFERSTLVPKPSIDGTQLQTFTDVFHSSSSSSTWDPIESRKIVQENILLPNLNNTCSSTVQPKSLLNSSAVNSLKTLPPGISCQQAASKPPPSEKFDKVYCHLETKYPVLKREQILDALREFRESLPSKKISGLKSAELLNGIEKMIIKQNEQLFAKNSSNIYGYACGTTSQQLSYAYEPSTSGPSTCTVSLGTNPTSPSCISPRAAETNECFICLNPLYGPRTPLDCGHGIGTHRECLEPWIAENKTCPICRQHSLLDDEYPKL